MATKTAPKPPAIAAGEAVTMIPIDRVHPRHQGDQRQSHVTAIGITRSARVIGHGRARLLLRGVA